MGSLQAAPAEIMEVGPEVPADFEDAADQPHLKLVPPPEERAPIDPVALIVDLRRHPKPAREEDRLKISRLATDSALFLQERLAAEGEEQAPQEAERFSEVYTWLDDAVTPIKNNLMSRYFTNSRTSRDDFRQVMHHHTLSEIIPNYDPSYKSYMSYYKSTAWARLQEYVYSNASQFFTPNKLSGLTEEERQRIFSAFSFDGREEGAVQSIAGDSESDMIRHIMTKDILTRAAAHVALNLSEVESTVFYLSLQNMSYDEIGFFVDMDEKAIDNALQRARKKLADLGAAEIMED
jgi:hypothetical protein